MNPGSTHVITVTLWAAMLVVGAGVRDTRGDGVPSQGGGSMEDTLMDARQHSIASIAAFTATGNLDELRDALDAGLVAGLTVNEIKEVLVQMYAYSGFPRSLRGLNTFIAVLDERKARGIVDDRGREATPLPPQLNKYEAGSAVLETLTGESQEEPKAAFALLSPETDVFLKEHLFTDIFGRDVLDYQERELATISALVSMGGVEPMVKSHMDIGLNVGLTKAQLEQVCSFVESSVGRDKAAAGRAVLSEVIASRSETPSGAFALEGDGGNAAALPQRPAGRAAPEIEGELFPRGELNGSCPRIAVKENGVWFPKQRFTRPGWGRKGTIHHAEEGTSKSAVVQGVRREAGVR